MRFPCLHRALNPYPLRRQAALKEKMLKEAPVQKVLVENLNVEMTEGMIKMLFEPLGPIKEVTLLKNEVEGSQHTVLLLKCNHCRHLVLERTDWNSSHSFVSKRH